MGDCQQMTRSKNRDDYIWADLTKQVYENGELQDTGMVAEKLCIREDMRALTVRISSYNLFYDRFFSVKPLTAS